MKTKSLFTILFAVLLGAAVWVYCGSSVYSTSQCITFGPSEYVEPIEENWLLQVNFLIVAE